LALRLGSIAHGQLCALSLISSYVLSLKTRRVAAFPQEIACSPMTKTAEQLREASQVACDKMREDLETLRNKLTVQHARTTELDKIIDQLRHETAPKDKPPASPGGGTDSNQGETAR
jgi:hypothetical protein